MSRQIRRTVTASVLAFSLAACGAGSDDATADTTDVITSYTDIAPSGFIDQTVDFVNRSNSALAITASFTALDRDGEPVQGITVETAFGSDRGLLVIPPGGYFDILRFEGERVAEVVDVDSTVTAVRQVETADLAQEIEPQPLADGVEVTKFDVFSDVRVQNPSNSDISLRIVCIDYDSPAPGEAQQAVEISEVVRGLRLSSGETKTAAVLPDFASRTDALGYGCASLKAHLTIPN